MNHTFLRDLITTSFGELKKYDDREQIQVNCPHCAKLYNNYEPDWKYNLEINLKKRVYKCWKCEISGPIPKLLKYYSSREIYNTYIENYDEIDYKQNGNKEDEDDEVYKQILLPKEFIKFSEIDTDLLSHSEAYNYLIYKRRFNIDLINSLNIGFCTDGYYKNRIIIPSYDKNMKLNYFIARSYLNDKISYLKPKTNQDVIFNEYNIDWNSTIYVVEGVFDYMSLPFNTLCLLGKEFIPYVFKLVVKYKPQMVFILDPDAIKQTIKYINIFRNLSLENIKFVELPNKTDIDELTNKTDIDELRIKIGEENLSNYILTNSKYLTDLEIIKYQ